MSPSSLGDEGARVPIEPEPTVLRWPGPELPAGEQLRASIRPGPTLRELVPSDLEGPLQRRVFLPAFLFVATCLSTFIAGASNWDPAVLFEPGRAEQLLRSNWQQGLIYMASVIGILLTHEMGHFLQTVRYGVPASLPFFIPVPVLMTGTMGAVIGMEGSRADRKQLFDIGISGPWAGLIVSLPIIWFGIKNAQVMPTGAEFQLGDPLIFKLLAG